MPLRNPQAELIKAIRRNDVCKVKFLLEQGLDPNFVDQSYVNFKLVNVKLINFDSEQFQFSPLHYAARGGNQQICMLLISIGAASLRGYTEVIPLQSNPFVSYHFRADRLHFTVLPFLET